MSGMPVDEGYQKIQRTQNLESGFPECNYTHPNAILVAVDRKRRNHDFPEVVWQAKLDVVPKGSRASQKLGMPLVQDGARVPRQLRSAWISASPDIKTKPKHAFVDGPNHSVEKAHILFAL
jgi:hypothetical protein